MVNDKIIVSDDIHDDMKAEVVMERINEVIRHEYSLRDYTRVVDTGRRRHARIPLRTKRVRGVRDVGELEEAPVSAQDWDTIERTLKKNVTHIALSEESRMSADFNVWNEHVQDAAEEIARLENLDVKDVLEDDSNWLTYTDTGDWTDDTDDPFKDIMAAATEMRTWDETDDDHARGFNPDTLLLDPGSYSTLLSNEKVVKRLERGATAEGEVQSLAGMNIAMDQTLDDTDEQVYLLDTNSQGIVLFDGPRLVRDYQEPKAFFDGYNIADFLWVEPVLDEAIIAIQDIESSS